MVYDGVDRYFDGEIYKIVDVGSNLCYIGSTCEKLSKTWKGRGQMIETMQVEMNIVVLLR